MKPFACSINPPTMKLFYAHNMEIAECELRDAGLPITQEGANQFAEAAWGKANNHVARKRRQLRGLYGKSYRHNTTQVC